MPHACKVGYVLALVTLPSTPLKPKLIRASVAVDVPTVPVISKNNSAPTRHERAFILVTVPKPVKVGVHATGDVSIEVTGAYSVSR